MEGVIKRIVADRGFGFIRTSDPGWPEGELFFHRSALERGEFELLKEGDHVSFEPDKNSPKGPRAELVQRIS